MVKTYGKEKGIFSGGVLQLLIKRHTYQICKYVKQSTQRISESHSRKELLCSLASGKFKPRPYTLHNNEPQSIFAERI